MKIALHDNILSLRGTTVALYDYAYYLKHYYNFECIILYNTKYSNNNNEVKDKFLKEFKVFGYNDNNQIDNILKDQDFISDQIIDNILIRYYYRKGTYQKKIKKDKVLLEAFKILKNKPQYTKILNGA